MQALKFWKTVTMDQANLLERLITLLEEQGIQRIRVTRHSSKGLKNVKYWG
jgi:hypothetical protein